MTSRTLPLTRRRRRGLKHKPYPMKYRPRSPWTRRTAIYNVPYIFLAQSWPAMPLMQFLMDPPRNLVERARPPRDSPLWDCTSLVETTAGITNITSSRRLTTTADAGDANEDKSTEHDHVAITEGGNGKGQNATGVQTKVQRKTKNKDKDKGKDKGECKSGGKRKDKTGIARYLGDS